MSIADGSGAFTLSRASVRDQALSIEAVGLLAWLTSHTDRFIAGLTEARIMHAVRVGRDKVRRMLRELADAGHLIKTTLTDGRGMTAGVRYGLRRASAALKTSRAADQAQQDVSAGQRLDGFSVKPGDQGGCDVSAGPRLDGFSGEHSVFQEEQERREEDQGLTRTPARVGAHTRETPPPLTTVRGGRMPSKKDPTQPPLTGMSAAIMSARAEAAPRIESDRAMAAEVQAVIDEWLQHCTHRPTSRHQAEVRAEVRALVADGVSGYHIRRGLADWMAKGLPPSVIDSFVNAAMNAPADRGRTRSRLTEVNGQHLSARNIEALARHERMKALADAQERQAIGGVL